MQLRCKEGDVALVVKEERGCEANLGRLVSVRGPVVSYAGLGATWLISPLTGAGWTYLTASGQVRRRCISRKEVEHPDAWMVPLREQPDDLTMKGSASRSNSPLTELTLSAS